MVQEVQRQGNPNVVMALVVNKCDLDPRREVLNEARADGERYAQENGMTFMETSAKTAHNVNELFHETAKKLAKASPSRPRGMTLNSEPQDGRRELLCCLG